ncbi:MAG: hypothetical protein AAF841_10600, partial [Pseudomonadota bacterium]
WGAALLDPAFAPIITKMAKPNIAEVPAEVDGRPFAYNQNGTIKVIILMTDGANTDQRDLPNFAKDALSPVWYNKKRAENSGNWYDGYYVDLNYEATPSNKRVPGWRDWYRPRSPWNQGDDQWMRNKPSGSVRLTYHELMMRFTPDDMQEFFWRWADYGTRNWGRDWDRPKPWDWTRHDNFNGVHTNGDAADKVTRDFCDLINNSNRNVQIFTIAFQAPDRGDKLMSYCATTPGHYYDVKGLDLATAFKSIASQINHLRLVQ